MKPHTAILLIGLALASGCSHAALTGATFIRMEGPSLPNDTQHSHLVLRISRHVDAILNGPDIDEDQLLVLDLRNFPLNRKLTIPSEQVTPRVFITRFGPSSEGKDFKGVLIVRSVVTNNVKAYMDLDIVARTEDNSYSQKVHIKGDFVFVPEPPDKDPFESLK